MPTAKESVQDVLRKLMEVIADMNMVNKENDDRMFKDHWLCSWDDGGSD